MCITCTYPQLYTFLSTCSVKRNVAHKGKGGQTGAAEGASAGLCGKRAAAGGEYGLLRQKRRGFVQKIRQNELPFERTGVIIIEKNARAAFGGRPFGLKCAET